MRVNGDAIRALRQARNLSLRALATQTGRDRGYLSRLERGLIRESDAVEQIAAALAVPPAAITHDTPKETKP